MLPRSERAYLVIGDISGYTGYLAGTEIEHAQDVLADLMETMVKSLRPAFRLAKLEGDAAFTYAPEAKADASMVLDTIERAYVAFRRRLQTVTVATTCRCNACMQIPSLDLKFFAHVGSLVRQRIMGREELAGSDVILVHRLMKNAVTEATGLRGYALVTDACMAALGLDPAALGMRPHVETYEHIGPVPCCIEDLEARWHDEQARVRVYVAETDMEGQVEADLPAPPPIVWDWLTSPGKRPLFQTGTTRVDQLTPGRRGVGTTNHCVHGHDVRVEEVLDWRPFDYVTLRYPTPAGAMTFMYELTSTGAGTHVVSRVQKMRGAKQREMWAAIGPQMEQDLRGSLARLAAILATQDVEEGAASQP